MNRLSLFLALPTMLIAALLAGCRGDTSGAAVSPEPTIPQLIHQSGQPELMELSVSQVPGARLATVKVVELPGVLETNGQVSYDDRLVSTIVSRVQGRIEVTRVSLWDNVRHGERIVAVYSPDFMTAEAEYLQAQQTMKLSAAPGIGEGGDISGSLLSAAKLKLELLGMSDADIAAIKHPDPTVWIRAPISGTVVENKAVRGTAVNPGDELFSLGTLGRVWITADIYEDDLARVKVGQQLEAVTTAFPDRIFHGTIDRISPAIDPNTHVATIRCDIANPNGELKPQMLARVKIVTRPGSALVVPQDSLIFETDSYFAYVQAAPDRLERRKVTIAGWNEHGYVRVIAGLSAGDQVVVGLTIQINAFWHEAHGETS